MGLFDKIFNGEDKPKEETKIPWNDLTDLDQLDQIEKESEENFVAILKHSTRCGVSRMVLRMFESDYNIPENESIKLYLLDLIAYREVSNEIEKRFGVKHESPQLIVIHNREVVHHSSHQSISAGKLEKLLA